MEWLEREGECLPNGTVTSEKCLVRNPSVMIAVVLEEWQSLGQCLKCLLFSGTCWQCGGGGQGGSAPCQHHSVEGLLRLKLYPGGRVLVQSCTILWQINCTY